MPFKKILQAEWSGLLLVVILAIGLIGYLKPSFLTPFNIQILLAAISVNLVIALAQMLIIGIGQMNLSVGAIGGFVAISFAGLMDAFQLSVPLAILAGLVIGLAAGFGLAADFKLASRALATRCLHFRIFAHVTKLHVLPLARSTTCFVLFDCR